MATGSFTGRTRKRETRWTVRWADRLARSLITLGGLGIIVAVTFVFVFLAWVVVPLFSSGGFEGASSAPRAGAAGAVVDVGMDEQQLMTWTLYRDGMLRGFALAGGKEIAAINLAPAARPTAVAVDSRLGTVAFGYGDGSVQLGRLGFTSEFIPAKELPAELVALKPGQSAVYKSGVVVRTTGNQLLHQQLTGKTEPLIRSNDPSAIRLIDQTLRGENPIFAAFTEDGSLRLYGLSKRTNLLTGEETATLSGGKIAIAPRPDRSDPLRILMSGTGDSVILLWKDGHIVRVDSRNFNALAIAETVDLLPSPTATVTAASYMIGRSTVLIGDSNGNVTASFRVRPEKPTSTDGSHLVTAHIMVGTGAPVTSLQASARTRTVAVGYADSSVRIFHVTSSQMLAESKAQGGGTIEAVTIAPKDDGVVALDKDKVWHWHLSIEHPEATTAAIFTPVWYEGYPQPEHVWQSSSGSDDFEPKFGMVPLIFGTIKATIYSMIFGVPVALLAAIYTSEFLHPSTKAKIKPTIEMMASLPSVVLGFLAALIIAPFVEDRVPHLLATFVTVPFTFVLGAHLWQLIPQRQYPLFAPYRLWFILGVIPLGVGLGWVVGSALESLLFAGDIKQWLDGQIGSARGGWIIAMLPVAAIMAALGVRAGYDRIFGAVALEWDRSKVALMALVKFLAGTVLTVGIAWILAAVLAGLGADTRDLFLGTYVQRNALVVGFVMGFAVIPIIYTLSEDALSSVPDHLRSGSLAAGATQWQTAIRIIVPTAMSGLFSAVMIGFGRAVGETMVVLMAAGNTPVMEWNIFNGFRTLSANIAVELPEAVRNSSHYRTLFLAALTLFVMTFALNTLAERVRQRFRKRAYQL